MSTKVLMDVNEYLHTSFEGSDCEFLDGEVVQRNMGELPHGDIQGNIYSLLRRFRSTLCIQVVPEIRIQIHPRPYRVADIAVWRNDYFGTGIPTVRPIRQGDCRPSEDPVGRTVHRRQ